MKLFDRVKQVVSNFMNEDEELDETQEQFPAGAVLDNGEVVDKYGICHGWVNVFVEDKD